jgi:hypothetical protein
MYRKYFSLFLIIFMLVGCSPSPNPSTPTLVNTPSPMHIATFQPTTTLHRTLIPPLTNTIAPTRTPKPTYTKMTSPTSTDTSESITPTSIFLAEGVWQCPENTEGALFVGSDKSNKFHRLNCEWALKIKPDNRLCFVSRAAALSYGYLPCGVCKP